MSMSTESARRAAVARAWKNEHALVGKGMGTRDWSRGEQAQILSLGKCKGYQGTHKYSVKNHPEFAGDEKNIQFLTPKEHLKAHNNNYKNDPHGRYDPKTGRVTQYADGKPKPEPVRKLSSPLSETEKGRYQAKYAELQEAKRAETKRRAAERAKTHDRLRVNKEQRSNTPSKRGPAAGAESTRTSKALQKAAASRGAASGPYGKTKTSKALSSARNATSSTARRSASASAGHGSVGSSGGTGVSHGGSGGVKGGAGGRGGH